MRDRLLEWSCDDRSSSFTELPKSYMAIHWKSLSLLIVPVMLWGYLTSAGL